MNEAVIATSKLCVLRITKMYCRMFFFVKENMI